MPYDKTTGLMTSPLNTYDVANAVGMSSQSDIGSMITKGSINKWAKCKPVVFNKYSDLSDDDRIGQAAQVNNGYYYGVKLGAKSGQGGNILGLHDVRFEYLRPTDHFRTTDFVGYSKSAKASVFCELPDSAANDVEKGMYFNVEYRAGNTSGIDVSEAVKSATGNAVTNCWPCLLLSSTDKATNYCCVLKKDSNGQPSKVTEGNTLFYADLTKVVNGTNKLPAGNYLITAFLYNPGSISQFKTDGTWFTVSSSQVWTGVPVVIPNNYDGDAGKLITVAASDPRPVMKLDSVTVSGSTLTITAVVNGTFGETVTWCECTPTITDANGTPHEAFMKAARITSFGSVVYTYDLSTDFRNVMKGSTAVTYTLSCVFGTYYPGQTTRKSSFDSKTFNY